MSDGDSRSSSARASWWLSPDTPTEELVDRNYPEVPWKGVSRQEYLANNPYRSLLDCSRAHQRLGWKLERHWREKLAILDTAQELR